MDRYPFTFTDVHYDDIPDGQFWACQHPERPTGPPGPRARYKRHCRACLIAFIATCQRTPEMPFTMGDKVVAYYGEEAALTEWWMIDSAEEMETFLARRSRP